MKFEISDDVRRELRWYLEEFMDLPDHGSIVRAGKIEKQIELWGRQLFDDVFAGEAQAAA